MSDTFRRTLSPRELQASMNEWPTFSAQEITVEELDESWQYAVIRLGLSSTNANFFGTAFGGSLFTMVDPFFVILAAQQLGPEYAVWDKSVEIDFARPGTGPVTARVEMPPEVVQEMRDAVADGQKLLRWFEVDVVGEDGEVVARQRRQLYVRKQRPRD